MYGTGNPFRETSLEAFVDAEVACGIAAAAFAAGTAAVACAAVAAAAVGRIFGGVCSGARVFGAVRSGACVFGGVSAVSGSVAASACFRDVAVCVVRDISAVAGAQNSGKHEYNKRDADELFHGIPPLRNFLCPLSMTQRTENKRDLRRFFANCVDLKCKLIYNYHDKYVKEV